MDSAVLETEVNRLKLENKAKDETLYQLKLKTKAFVDSMRKELAAEKAKVAHFSSHSDATAKIALENDLQASKITCERLQQQLDQLQRSGDVQQLAIDSKMLADKHQQHEIEIEHLQKKLLDRDFQLEQLQMYREKLIQSEEIAANMQQQNGALRSQLEKLSQSNETEHRRDDRRLVELQEALQNSLSRIEILEKQLADDTIQMMRMHEQIRAKESILLANESEIHRLRSKAIDPRELEELDAKYRVLQSEFESHKTLSEANHKDELSKRQKAKTLVLALSADKQSLLDEKAQQQCEIDRLRMELNHKNVENERRIKQLNENSQQKLVQAASSVHELTDEIQILKQTLHVLQESEKSQQRARELADAKRQVEESNKKRFAAKAETQKLAIELEQLQKIAQQHNLSTQTLCRSLVHKHAMLAERVQEALQIVDKRVQKQTPCDNQVAEDETRHPEIAREDKMTPKGTRGNAFNQQSFLAIDTAEQSLTELREKLAMLVELTEKLCDLSMEQQEVSLKDVLKTRVTQFVTQCFAEKVRQTYTKVDEGTESLFESAKASQKLVQAASSVHELTDEIQILKQTLHVLQESEKSQQRARELADAKRQVEESNKKRFAAKAETQKLAIELEQLQKIAQQHNLSTQTLCRSLVHKHAMLAERVQEALQIVDKRVQKQTPCDNQVAEDETRHPEIAREDKMTPKGTRGNAFNQQSFLAIDTAEQSLTELREKLAMLVELTEKLCDLSMEQQEVSLKDVLKTRVTQFVTQCFAEKVRQTYTKVDEGTESLFESAKASVHSSS
ncbi:hypothetical protein ABG067_004873 [Albugo candida]